MGIKGIKTYPFFLLLSFLFLIVGIWGTIRLCERPGIMVILEESDGHLLLSQFVHGSRAEKSGLRGGDIILEVDKNPVKSQSDFNFYLDHKRVGESVNLTLQRNVEEINCTVPLERKNGYLFLLINALAGFFLWMVGVFVFLKSPKSSVARIFSISSLSFSLAVFISWEGFPQGPIGLSFILPSFQIIAYTLIPALFLHFSTIFPGEEDVPAHRIPTVYYLYLPSLVLITLLEISYWRSVSSNSLSLFQTYKTFFLYFRVYLVVYVLLGISLLYRTYSRLEFLEDRRRIRWIFWGIAVGTFPFVFLHTLSEVLFGRALIPEVVNYLFMFLIPISFAFSILRYKAMDIDVVINSSVVYSLLAGFIVGVYLFVAELLGEIVHKLTGYQGSLFFILAGIVAALLFTPAKNRISVFVDKTLYRVRYDYREAIQKFIRQVGFTITRDQLLDLLFRKFDVLLEAKAALLFLKKNGSKEFKLAKSFGFSEVEIKKIEKLKNTLPKELFKTGKIKATPGATAFKEISVLPDNESLKEFEIKLSFPLTEKNVPFGLLLIGKKKSEVRYSVEDVELVSLMVQEVAQALLNVEMRERVMAEKLEREKLEELNKLKTKFISNVSHDLRTPLTSIRFSADNMLKGVCGEISEESRKNLEMIQESTLHVSRMIDNLLTLSMSESGKIVLNKEKLPLVQVVGEACGIMTALAEKKGVNLVKGELEDVFVYADKHSLFQILLNLLDNAVKYTEPGGEICVSSKRIHTKEFVEISVTDDGIGISPENLEKIFERFSKITPEGAVAKKGLGIGLDIVKNLVDLHHGEIKVQSPVPGAGKGAKFSFTLPLRQ